MRFFRQLIDLLTEPSARISDILRKAKVLAATVTQEEFKEWAAHELNGYPPDSELPDYRSLSSLPFGDFRGPFGGSVSNLQLPVSQMPEFFQEKARALRLPNPIAEIEGYARSQGDDLRHPWGAEKAIFAYYGWA